MSVVLILYVMPNHGQCDVTNIMSIDCIGELQGLHEFERGLEQRHANFLG